MARNFVRILFNAPENKELQMHSILRELELDLPYSETGYSLKLDTSDPKLRLLLSSFERDGIPYHALYEKGHSLAELEAAKFLHVMVNATCGKRHDYPDLFDLSSSCPRCGSGADQVGNLRIDKLRWGSKDIAITSTHEIVISKKLLDELLLQGLTGVSTRPVEHSARWRSAEPEPRLFQLAPSTILPPMAPQMVFEKDSSPLACPECGSGLMWREAIPFLYNSGIQELGLDLSWTREEFGWVWRKPELVVSQRAYRTLRRANAVRVKFLPVEILPEN